MIRKLYLIRLKRGRPSKVNDVLLRMDVPSNDHNNGANNKKREQEIHDLSSTRNTGRKMNHEQNKCACHQRGFAYKRKRYKHGRLNNCVGKSQ